MHGETEMRVRESLPYLSSFRHRCSDGLRTSVVRVRLEPAEVFGWLEASEIHVRVASDHFSFFLE